MSRPRPVLAVLASVTLLLAVLSTTVAVNDETAGPVHLAAGAGALAAEPIDHLLVSEVMTGGASASDELIELYNPSTVALPLEGLEVIYVTATGGTITRKASWAAGAASLPSGAHLLIANGAGAFAGIADVTYTNGLAAPGGSVAIRILGAGTAIDAVGWGTAASTWVEGGATQAPAAGHSIERLPGGSGGSGQDTNDNGADFVERTAPDPQNTASAPIVVPTPAASPTAAADTGDDRDAHAGSERHGRPDPHANRVQQSDANRDPNGHVPCDAERHAAHAASRPDDHAGADGHCGCPRPAGRRIGPGGRGEPDRQRLQRWRRLPGRCDGWHRRPAQRRIVPARHDPARAGRA